MKESYETPDKSPGLYRNIKIVQQKEKREQIAL